jgi:hypothetical protein
MATEPAPSKPTAKAKAKKAAPTSEVKDGAIPTDKDPIVPGIRCELTGKAMLLSQVLKCIEKLPRAGKKAA